MNLLNFSSIFSGPENVFWFGLGVLSVQVWQWVKAKWKDFKYPKSAPHPFKRANWLYVAIAMTWMISIFIGVDNQRTYNFASNLARQVQQCQAEFNTTLRARSVVAEENDNWSQVQRTALGNWLHELLSPPDDIAQLRYEDPSNPRVQQWVVDVTRKYDAIIQKAQAEQDLNQKERPTLPDPTCGKPLK